MSSPGQGGTGDAPGEERQEEFGSGDSSSVDPALDDETQWATIDSSSVSSVDSTTTSSSEGGVDIPSFSSVPPRGGDAYNGVHTQAAAVRAAHSGGLTSAGGNYGQVFYSSEFEDPATTHYRNWAETIWDIYSTQKRMEAESAFYLNAPHQGWSGGSGEEADSYLRYDDNADLGGETSAKDTERESDLDRADAEFEDSVTTGGADDVRERTSLPVGENGASESESSSAEAAPKEHLEPPNGSLSAGESAAEVVAPPLLVRPSVDLGANESDTGVSDAVSDDQRLSQDETTAVIPEPADVPSTVSPFGVRRSEEELREPSIIRTCENCRERLESSTAKFCTYCGTRVVRDDDDAVSPDPSRPALQKKSTASSLAAKFEAWERSESKKKVG